MKALLILATGIALLGIAGAGNSGHGCNGIITDVGGVAYIDDRDINVGGVWVYVESNGQAGLQSGGPHPVLGAADFDPCVHANPDTLIL